MTGKPLNDAIDQVIDIIRRVDPDQLRLPATFLFNEGWMLRLILKAAESQDLGELPQIKSQWFSEAKLYTPFKKASDQFSEGFTNADAVVGEFEWADKTKTGVQLAESTRRFEVFEAKMYSPLSKGVMAASWFDQAARTVACMAYTLARKNFRPDDPRIEQIGFWLIAPDSRICAGVFKKQITKESIQAKVVRRIQQFTGQPRESLDLWREEYFEPLLNRLEIHCISWEELIGAISDDSHRTAIQTFYDRCRDAAGRGTCDQPSQKPLRGRTYRIVRQSTDELVVVCCPGEKTSRVFIPDTDCESFKVANHQLELVDGSVAGLFSIPSNGEFKLYRGKQVVVTSRGPCRSHVTYLNLPGIPILVENHFLKPPEAAG